MHRVAAISGSLRSESYNTATLNALRTMQRETMDIDVITLEDVPLFNEDVEAQGWPSRVQQLRDRVGPAVGVIIATPEYNYGVPGVLKNAIDWLSRPTGKGPLVGKPLVIIGASMSKVGTARAQSQVREAAFYNAMPLLPSAEVLISKAQDVFRDDGTIADSATREFLNTMLTNFAKWIDIHRDTARIVN